jgi:integrase
LNNLFDYIGSSAVRSCLARYPYLRVSSSSERFDPIPDQVVEAVYAEAATVDENDWSRLISYAVAVIALSTGMRSKEMRLCDIQHIHADSSQWTVDVLHPKGEGNWGKPRNTPIDPRAYPFLKKFFVARMKRVRDREMNTRALFPGGQIDGYFAPNTIREFCKNVSKEVGYDFNLRDCRRTYGQHLINLGADIETVSKLLGHATTSTTEGYYCSLRQQKAIERATELFAYQPIKGRGIDMSQLPAGFDMSMESNQSVGNCDQNLM